MDILIESFLIAVIAGVFSLCAKLSWDYYDIDELVEIIKPGSQKFHFTWKMLGIVTPVMIVIAEIVYWAFIK